MSAAWGTTGCDPDNTALDCLCTEEFRSFTVTVFDGAGAPVEGMSLTVTRTRDGFEYPAGHDLGFTPGTYSILDDGAKRDVGAAEAVQVVATKNGVSVTGSYVFSTDDCMCHINKVSGPDTLVWGVAP